ncbi:chondroitin AC/alginate lyase [Cutaneotrichosporon oleaginosum]|uniref:Chondroitin AC/alginate lyase n=1 Tax=Cutaneotrichosporon oleaginosum TaxID=879819 RepID=A0A0J0XMG7_9TREE|nr:chondroitin AC/alginate lyase [Cutaneotrichosporon oleaginosum]KLT42263.1 chondroitin AC/alginate lyase [Cutaneotrichosporon oleaginosum]TXT11435.1 hypothetical protein COLE_01845 [Cutaneotrichosporon oleaginosum]
MVAGYALLATALLALPGAHAVVNYASDFVDPSYILDFKYEAQTTHAQQTIVSWANRLGRSRPWSVLNKPYLAPTNDPHDYMSWAPYYWPDCSNAGNTSVLAVDEMFKTCLYSNHDGALNPDARLVNNIGDFDEMSNAIFYASMAWGVTRSKTYSHRAASLIDSWFLHEKSYMNPHLNYAQLKGGPAVRDQMGRHTGVLDLKGMIKIASGALLLRQGNAEGWNATIDGRFQTWVSNYTNWIKNSPIAQDEEASVNNHGTFYSAQLAALQLITNDTQDAAATIQKYFDGHFKHQIKLDGSQPYELNRTRPYHYLAYNLAAMVTAARIGEYAGINVWDTKSDEGATIQTACDFAMNYDPKNELPDELYPVVAAVAAHYGDPDGKYSGWLNQKTNGQYVTEPSFFWTQPLSDSGNAVPTFVTFARGGRTGTITPGTRPTGGTSAASRRASLPLGALALPAALFALAGALYSLF